jgi:phosphoribosylanthranilate isomerase
MSVVVKICGIRTVEDARVAVAAGADLLGLNFVPTSPRRLALDDARAIAAAVDGVPLVGIFADAARETVAGTADAVGLAGLQFHGDESPAFCRGWRQWTIKALRARPDDDLAARAATFDTDYVLVDSFVPGAGGGTGVALDPTSAQGIPAARLFLAGGLCPDTVADLVRLVRPHGVDVASGVERSPGVKDHDKIQEFVRRAKAA